MSDTPMNDPKVMIPVGSVALNYHFPGVIPNFDKRFKDSDFISSYQEFESWSKTKKFKSLYPIDAGKKMIAKTQYNIFEIEIAWPGSTAESFLNLVANDSETKDGIPSLNALYALKNSHKYLRNAPSFKKTMDDIIFMKSKGAVISDYYKEWFKVREKETYNYSHPNLSQNKMGFFNLNEGVKYYFDHDSIHQQVARMEKPAYTYYMKDGAEVQCSKEKFFNGTEEIRLFGVVEEATVLSLERSQIPHKGKITPKQSFLIALEKICTSVTSGWFREFAWNNYYKVLELYDDQYVNKFWVAVEQGLVKVL